MPLFTYKVQDVHGKVLEDTIQGTDRSEVASILKADGLKILKIKKMQSANDFFGGKISVSDKAEFCRLMGTMLRSGLSVPESVEIIRQEAKSKKLQNVLADISDQTRKGNSISSVLTRYEKEFGPVFLTMVKAGEESGTLDQSFDYLSKQLGASHELSQKVKGALMYPAVIIVAMLGNAILMLVFVLPKISDVFLKMKIELPVYTKIILGFGAFVGENTILALVAVVLLAVGSFLFVYLRPTRKLLLSTLGRVGAVKKIMDQIDISRFARTLSTLLKSGVSIIESLNVAADSMSQPKLKGAARKFSKGVGEGRTLSDILVESKGVFPSVVVQTIRAGEKTGSLEEVLIEMAEFYEKEVEHSLKNLTALLEPVMMLIIGVAVGLMVIIMIAPIYSIVGSLQVQPHLYIPVKAFYLWPQSRLVSHAQSF